MKDWKKREETERNGKKQKYTRQKQNFLCKEMGRNWRKREETGRNVKTREETGRNGKK